MANKIKVYMTEPLQRTVTRYSNQRTEERNGGTVRVCDVEKADYTGQIEVYIDLDALLEHYSKVAFNNKNRKFTRGLVEARVVNMKEVPGTRTKETR